MTLQKHNPLFRIRFLSVCIFLFALVLIGRLYFLQIIESDKYLNKADRQYQSTSKNVFDRGTIFFQNKDASLVSAATLRSGFIIAVNPEVLKDSEAVYLKVNEIMPTSHDEFIAKATKIGDPYEEIATHVDGEIGKKISDLKIPGLQAYKERWRFYPGGNTASHVVGLLGFKGDEYAGRYGLERQYEKILQRNDGAYVNFFAQIFSDIKSVTKGDESLEADIITTIEPTVQSHLQGVLEETNKKWSSDGTGAIVMNPMTGEIYAMEFYPSFDPNNSGEEKNASIFSNPIVENIYEMGSVIKTLTMASGIDAGVVTANTTYYDRGYLMINNKRVGNFDDKERGIVSMQDVLSQSLNVGAAFVEQKLGNARFSEYMYNFGLGNKTGIELPNEAKNLVTSLDSKIDIDLASASFGQSIALTPISTISAISVIANGGTTVKPHLVKSVKYKVGLSKDTEIGLGQRVIKRETSEEVSRMMVYSMDNVLANGTLKLPRHSVAVKTGTAQIAKPGGGGYYEDRILHSFVGFFPAYNPKFIIFMYSVNPKGARFGSETLTGPFVEMVKFLINYYEVPPDR
ncbi:MAG: cell division protein FtsI (penicillin-binding protein 3) [Parcubacteria group bacterium Gr01-1014_46]|nr:MAG: cell division protein FtsI (penicillin-binding protein 3) [Parcubacteria group bacterium Gr01-1014_46]